MMWITSERFGDVEVKDDASILFPSGMIGFPQERQFVLLRSREASPIGWLQSTATPGLAFPVISVEALTVEYPALALIEAAARAGMDESVEAIAVMAVLSAPAGAPATVNLLAPIVVNADTRTGAQVLLETAPFSTREPLTIRRPGPATSGEETGKKEDSPRQEAGLAAE